MAAYVSSRPATPGMEDTPPGRQHLAPPLAVPLPRLCLPDLPTATSTGLRSLRPEVVPVLCPARHRTRPAPQRRGQLHSLAGQLPQSVPELAALAAPILQQW